MAQLMRRPLLAISVIGSLTASCALGAAVASEHTQEPPGHAYLIPTVIHQRHISVTVIPLRQT